MQDKVLAVGSPTAPEDVNLKDILAKPDLKPNTNVACDPVYESFIRSIAPLHIGPREKTPEAVLKKLLPLEREITQRLEEDLQGGRHYVVHSETSKTIKLIAEDGDTLSMAVVTNTRGRQVRELIGTIFNKHPGKLELFLKLSGGWTRIKDVDEVPSEVRITGVKNFCRQRRKYEHPIMVLGAGFGGIVTGMKLLQRGRTDMQIVEKLNDFGGYSWYGIANRTTKLQTEAGSYHLPYFFHDQGFPEGMPTWPSRDYLLMMFQRTARKYGLEEYTRFNTKVLKIVAKQNQVYVHNDTMSFGDGKPEVDLRVSTAAGHHTQPHDDGRWFTVHCEPADGLGDVEMFSAGACLCWPGNLTHYKSEDYEGEEDFRGYIEYASLDRPDYTQVTGKATIIIGHGAFSIENVRTCLEFDCGKMTIVCRRRNITAPKIISWMVTRSPYPIPGPLMLDAMADAYKLLNWDPWTAYSVKTDSRRTFARIDQGTMFGVTDVYFVAGYYGVMDVVVGAVKRLTHHCMHLITGERIHCEAILKTVGVRGSYEVDKMLGLKELVGYWVNGNPLCSCVTNSLFVQASNFAGFSIGPGLTGTTEQVLWLVDNPQDLELVRSRLPVHNKKNNTIWGNALYVYSIAHATNTALIMLTVPGLSVACGLGDSLKWKKTQLAHPESRFINECRAEWEMYCDMCENHPAANKDVLRPPFPYTAQSVEEWIRKADAARSAKG